VIQTLHDTPIDWGRMYLWLAERYLREGAMADCAEHVHKGGGPRPRGRDCSGAVAVCERPRAANVGSATETADTFRWRGGTGSGMAAGIRASARRLDRRMTNAVHFAAVSIP
jgi:hypothetical protein